MLANIADLFKKSGKAFKQPRREKSKWFKLLRIDTNCWRVY